MGVRRSYKLKLTINEIMINEVIIDPHYQAKHNETINDELILNLVKKLNESEFTPVDVKDNYQYFINDPIYYNDKPYRLVWLIEQDKLYIGVINAFRR